MHAVSVRYSLLGHTVVPISLIPIFFKILFIYLMERETAREGTQAGGVGEEEASSQWSREPDAGLDPRTLGSRPEPKADA